MQIGEKDFDFAPSTQELGDLDGGNEISCVWATCSCCTPEYLKGPYSQDAPNDVRAENLLNVRGDKVVLLSLGESW